MKNINALHMLPPVNTISLKFKVKFHEPLDQYQACLYSFKCIFHAESKNNNENLIFEKFWKKLENFGL